MFSMFGRAQAVYIESLTIYTGLLFAALLSASADLLKERQFLQLKNEINNQTVKVYRGAYGTMSEIPIKDLVVGDIVDLNQGDRVPADCLILEEINMVVDESIYYPGNEEAYSRFKEESRNWLCNEMGNYIVEDNHREHPDPFLLTDSKIMKGQGKAIVCCVGENTILAKNRKPGDLVINEQQTDLEKKLEKASKQISKYAYFATGVSVITGLIFYILCVMISTEKDLFTNQTLLQGVKIVIIAVVLLIVAIPEGLPLAVSIAMALSINKMKEDQILIKNLESIQSAAMLHDLCIGKTGTITKGQMNVERYQLVANPQPEEHNQEADPTYFIDTLQVQAELKELIINCIASNTDVRIEINDKTCSYEPKGSALEVGMVQFLLDNEVDVANTFIQRNLTQRKITQLPFDQTLKRMTTVRIHPQNEHTVRIVVKGAPEYVIPYCDQTFNQNLMRVEISDQLRDQLLNDTIHEMASQPLKVITYAFKEMEISLFNQLIQAYGEESKQFRDEIERELVYLGTFGLYDPLRKDVEYSVEMIRFGKVVNYMNDSFDQGQGAGVDEEQYTAIGRRQQESLNQTAQVNVRMISGDHIETCRKVALQAHIISEDELHDEGVVITGEQFREEIGPTDRIWDEKKKEFIISFLEGKQKFDNIKRRVKVIARCTSEDKYIFVSGIKQKGGLVGMTGYSINDAEALQKADVGFCMGSGCDVAKDNSDLVILDNDFESIHSSIKWGRSIFDNVKKFMQYQLTINIAICVVTILGGATVGFIPLNVVQMLWINLMMDILAAISLGTEPYSKQLDVFGSHGRISRKNEMITPEIFRQILVIAIYQIVVMMILMYLGVFMFFDETFNLVTLSLRDETGNPTNRMVLNTICFHTFFLMNWFNTFSTRCIHPNEFHPFNRKICNNPIMWIVLILELGIQQFMLYFGEGALGSALLGITKITPGQTAVCWLFGVITLLVSIAAKQIPAEKFKFYESLDLEGTRNKTTIIDKINSQSADLFHRVNNKVQEDDDVLE